MSDGTRNFAVGVTALLALAGLMTLVMLFGNVPLLVEDVYRVQVLLPYSGGLNESNRVSFSGIDVGRIDTIELRDPPGSGVLVTAAIRSEYRIPAGTVARVSSGFIGGSPTLGLDASHLTDAQRREFLPTDGSAVLDGKVTTMASAMGEALGGPLGKLDKVAASFETLSAEWTAVGANLRALTDAVDPAAVDGGEAPGNLTTVIRRADATIAELRAAVAEVKQLIGDEKLICDLKATASNVASVTGKLDRGVEGLLERYGATADAIAEAAAGVKATLDQARTGEGTVGKLMSDPALYDNLNDAAQRLGEATAELKAILEKLKNEGLPVKF